MVVQWGELNTVSPIQRLYDLENVILQCTQTVCPEVIYSNTGDGGVFFSLPVKPMYAPHPYQCKVHAAKQVKERYTEYNSTISKSTCNLKGITPAEIFLINFFHFFQNFYIIKLLH